MHDGGYATISGTSMATPHVTGAVPLYLHANGQSPAQDAAGVSTIETAIVGAAHPQGTDEHACSYDDDRLGGPLLFTNSAAFGGDGTCGVANGGDPDPDPGDYELEADGYKVRGVQHADLTWSGSAGDEVDIHRGGGLIAAVPDDGAYTDDIGNRGSGSYSYQVCDAGTDTCSNVVTVDF